MATSDIFNYSVDAPKSPRNVFGIGYSTLFTSPAGMILPAYVEDVKANDKLSLSASCIVRTRPVNTSAFMSFDEKVDFWYVPYRLIFSAYPEWRISQSYSHSTSGLYNAGGQYLLPSTTWSSLYQALSGITFPNDPQYDFTRLNIPGALRLLDLLGYGSFSGSSQYGIIPMKADLGASSTYKGLTSVIKSVTDGFTGAGLLFNYFRLAAYQCVYQHGYRNEEYEPFDATSFNCDGLFLTNNSQPVPNNTVGSSDLTNSTPSWLVLKNEDSVRNLSFGSLLTVRYKNWRKDLFTAIKPNNGVSSAPNFPSFTSGQDGTVGTSFDWPTIIGDSEAPDNGRFQYNGYSNLANSLLKVTEGKDYAVLYAQQVYELCATDKYLRAMIYGSKNLSDQMRVLLGADAYDEHRPVYLGSFSNDISINEIVAQSAGTDGSDADGSTSVLGQLAGKGYGSASGNVFDYTFKEDGVVIGMHYIMPRNNYDSSRTSRFNTKVSRWDYYYPYFDGLGLQPVYRYERSTLGQPGAPTPNPTALLGFSPRYFEYKTRQSEVHGTFQYSQVDQNWTLSNNSYGAAAGSSVLMYKISPFITDRIFSLAFDGSMQSDPFMCYFSFDVKRVSNLERIGVPKL